MIYAKCIRRSQIADSKEDFISREKEEHYVYCVGETTKSHDGMDTLYCIPLNFIYDCLKHGRYIAIIDVPDNRQGDYIKKGSPSGLDVITSEQTVTRIIDSYTKEAIDFVFEEVKDPELVHGGYIHFLPEELKEYFNFRKNNNR